MSSITFGNYNFDQHDFRYAHMVKVHGIIAVHNDVIKGFGCITGVLVNITCSVRGRVRVRGFIRAFTMGTLPLRLVVTHIR